MKQFDQKILSEYIQNPWNADVCLAMAEEYMKMQQYSAAFTYYMKAAERFPSGENEKKYHCLIMISNIYFMLGDREESVMIYAKHAKAECPTKPESYYLMAIALATKILDHRYVGEVVSAWTTVYENAKIGLDMLKMSQNASFHIVNDPDSFVCLMVLSSLYVGNKNKADEIMSVYKFSNPSSDKVRFLLSYIDRELGVYNTHLNLDETMLDGKIKDILMKDSGSFFAGQCACVGYCESVFARIFNDFSLNKDASHFYVDISNNSPTGCNLSYILEKYCGWKGADGFVGTELLNEYNTNRSNMSIYLDENLDFVTLFKSVPERVGLLRMYNMNIENVGNWIHLIDLDNHVYNVIQIRHDEYKFGDGPKNTIYNYLTAHGYVRVVSDIQSMGNSPFKGSNVADWYVHESILDNDAAREIYNVCNKSNVLLDEIYKKSDYVER